MALTPEEEKELARLQEEVMQAEGSAPGLNEKDAADISFADRFKIKNFGGENAAAVDFLKTKYPDMDFEVFENEIYARSPGEDFKRLDPKGFDLQDISDVAVDVGAGIASGAATALGGLTGAALGPAGAVGGAAAAGGASSAALEALRQRLGQTLGVSKEYDPTAMGTAAAFGAASPVLFGTGATAGQIARRGLDPRTQRSALTRGLENITPKITEMVTGVPKQATQVLIDRPEDLAKVVDEGALPSLQKFGANLQDEFFQLKRQVGDKFEKMFRENEKTVSAQPLKDAFDSAIQRLETSKVQNQVTQQNLESLRNLKSELLDNIPDDLSPVEASYLQQQIADQIDNFDIFAQAQGRASDGGAKEALNSARKNINEQLDDVTEGLSTEAKKEWSAFSKLQRDLNRYFGDEQKTYNTLRNMDSQGKKVLKERLDDLGMLSGGKTQARKEADTLQAFQFYEDPSWTPISSGGTTSTSRTVGLQNLGGSLGYKIAGPLGQGIGYAGMQSIGSPAAVKGLIQGAQRVSPGAAKVINPQTMNPLWLMMLERGQNRGE